MNEQRVKPLADIHPVWERDISTYPDTVRVAMEDGQVVTYRRDDQQPAPSFLTVMNVLEKMPVYGGDPAQGYKAKHTDRKERRKKLWASQS